MYIRVRIVIVMWLGTLSTLSEYRVIQPGTLNVSQWNLFWQNITQSDCVFQLMLGLEEYYSPSPLGDFNRLFLNPPASYSATPRTRV